MKPTSFVPHSLSARTMPTLVALAAALAAFASTGGSSAAGQTGTDRAVSEWPMHGRDAAETRYSPLDQIDTDNVGGLELAWRWEIPKTGARLETTPLVVDGVMYATGALSFVFALDAATGDEIWRWDPGIPDAENGGPRACCGDVNRGVAVDGDMVYAALLDGRLMALDRHDGSVRWTTQTTPPGSDYTVTGAPRVAGDAVIIGNGGAEYGVRGYVTAYDAETGEQLWRTYTVPGNPALGFENEAMRAAAETWTGEWWVAGGGGTVWDAMVHDASAGLFYIGTGNGSPWNRDHRSPGGGDNLYLSAIVALDADDGSVVWHYQTTPGDDWDYTATQPLMLLDLEIGGRERQVIVQAPKNGFFYVVDRITGELISAEAFADDLTWASGVDLETGRPIETPEARYGMNGRGVYLAPGPRGAHNWHTMSFNPGTGLVYLPATNNNYYYEMTGTYEYEAGRWNTGTARGDAGRRPERPALQGPANLLLGWDPAENREVWRVPARGGHGGTMTTAGNLVFWATGSNLAALDARTGQELWSADIGGGAGSPVTYSIDGRQYVSIAAGRVSSVGAPYIWTFALDAGAGPAGAGPSEWTTAAPEDVGLSSEVLARIGPTMQQFIDADRTAGIMTLVARHGEIVHREAHGWRVLGEDPLEPDDIFRIYSMTKPVTSVAAMMLVEEGLLSLDTELASVIPEFADAKVYESSSTRGEGELDGVRLLQPETVRRMTRNHLSKDLIAILPGLGDTGFGLGFAVPADEEDGAYWWSGVANTYFWIDPAEKLVAFAWTQLQPFGGAPVNRLLRPIVYESILNGN